ncbi:hypothetical protein PHYBLDRAFT_143627 [Phycomyces blakesleeanus NRRL 1555(-)]|uniref:Uncharacterized protein n=1 Tax=Phycomyces blakesleeanus (strain ATCC 8743b / DSM 1359 / FGSC 10004 / NBRC 33097 / NRRL 1555) TaxID=763407 RepID=A0A162PYC8_PHYB8|nr:hypothetical protein PHYBLDRAFT_143627 [Phycomyces blakesleeanus NRRL 1555(-)]OAD75376.1 hypothetical protein PHYBLDRAFT_143627 [Phycomyces blakesleeanus NRRL 1555(-)]|eukprot:XP_018293416.1 hypothetical protein PHYBLDRAFT_143627 [Phycomyces blakesleeanus NRRL 1555(-)]
MYLEDLYQNDKIEITVFTINQHLLQHYPNMIGAFGPPHAYSTRSVEHAIGKYSCAIKSNSAINMNAGNYENMSAGWPITSKGKCACADSDIEFWGPLVYKTSDDSFEDISCLLILIQDFHRSMGVECGAIEPAIITSCKAFINGCVIDSSFSQKTLREAHHVCLQMQVDLTVLYNGIPVVVNGQLKPKVVHLVDVKELVGLVVSDAMGSTTTTTTTKYIVWPELNRGPKLNIGQYRDL